MFKVMIQEARFASETDNYSSANISNGYGLVTKVGAHASGKGAKVHMNVDFTMKTVTKQNMKKVLDKHKSLYTDEQWHTLEENYAAGGFLGGVLAGAFGLLFGGGSYNHYKNQHDKEVKVDNKEHQKLVEDLHNVARSTIKYTGEVEATSQTQLPVDAYCYVEITTIKFKDGNSLSVINSDNPVAADADGNTNNIDTTPGKLHVEPISG